MKKGTITAIVLIMMVLVLGVGGFLVWWYLIRSPAVPSPSGPQPTRLRVTNNCSNDIWIQQENLPSDPAVIKLAAGKSHDYTVPDAGLGAVRLWPKTDCDSSGNNCSTGQSQTPCPAGGCQPPFESKAEFTFGNVSDPNATTAYDISFADGYTLPITVIVKGSDLGNGNCQTLDCSGLTLDQCPTSDTMAGQSGVDLQVKSGGKTIACIAPCQKAVQPSPWGLGGSISSDPGLHMCCPTPCKYLTCKQGDPCNCDATNCQLCSPTTGCTWANSCATTDTCSDASDPNSVVNTEYYKTVKKLCPHAYGYAYDDNPKHTPVMMSCSADTQFEVVFCPGQKENISIRASVW